MVSSPNPLITSPQPPGLLAPKESAESVSSATPERKVWVDAIKKWCQRFGEEDKDLDWRIYARYVTVEKFVQGEQFGRVSRLDGSWRARPRKDGDPRYVHNWLRGHSRAILSQWTLAAGEFNVIALPDGDATDENEGAARNAKAVLEHYQRTLINEEFKQREGMFAQTTGQMLRYTYWDANAGGTAKRPQYEDEEVESPGTWTCADCGICGDTDGLQPDGSGGMVHGGMGGMSPMVGAAGQTQVPMGGQANDQPTPSGQPNGYGVGQGTAGQNGIGGIAGTSAGMGRDMAGQGISPQGDNVCPACGSPNIAIEPGQTTTLPKIAGYDQVKTGDMVCLSVPGYQVKYDRLPVRMKDSLWLRWRQYVRPEVVKEALPKWKKEPAGTHEEDWGLRAEQTVKRSVGNIEATQARLYGQPGYRHDADLIAVDRWWFRPAVYKNVELKADLELASGDVIPAGTIAGDAFPDGLYVMMINGEPLDFRNEDFRAHWQHTPAMLLPSRIDGDGLLDDLIEPQKEINDIKGLKLSNIKHVAGAGLMYRPAYLERQDISGKPYELAPIKPGTPDEMPLTDIIAAIPRPALSAEVYNYEEQMHEEMRFMAASYPSSTGEGDPDQKTASGAHLLSQNAQSQRAPELALRASGDVEWAGQVLKLFQENATDEMYIPFQGKVGQLDGRWFKGADLPKAFVVTMRPRSYIPKSENDRRNDFNGLLMVFGGVQGLLMAMQAAPDLVREACDRFNVSIDFGNMNLAHQVARLRLEAMKALLPQAIGAAQAMDQPEMAIMAVLSAPDTAVDPDDPHEQMIEFYVKWKLEDEGLQAKKDNPPLVACVSMQIQAHKGALVTKQQEAAGMQVAAQAPMIQQQQQMQEQQAAQQAEVQRGQQAAEGQQQQQQMQAQGEQQAQQAAMQEAQAQAQRDHEITMAQVQAKQQAAEADAAHKRALEVEGEKRKTALAVAKARPKGAGE